MIKAVVKTIFQHLHLLEPAHYLRWQIDRQFGHVDRQLRQQYMSHYAVHKLHIGCGYNLLPDWINADYFPESADVLHMDATRQFPFDDSLFDYVFAEHMIEHISYHHGLHMLQECYRVLRADGKIRISTPDLTFLVHLYDPDKSPLQREYIKWSTRSFVKDAPEDNEAFVINNFVRNWGHTFIYDQHTLKAAMTKAGFRRITKCDLQESEDDVLCNLENETRMPPDFLRLESFTLEGTK